MKRLLAFLGVAGIVLAALCALPASAEEKPDEPHTVCVVVVDDYVDVLVANLTAAIEKVRADLTMNEVERISVDFKMNEDGLVTRGVEVKRRYAMRSHYLHRSQAWIKANNSAVNVAGSSYRQLKILNC